MTRGNILELDSVNLPSILGQVNREYSRYLYGDEVFFKLTENDKVIISDIDGAIKEVALDGLTILLDSLKTSEYQINDLKKVAFFTQLKSHHKILINQCENEQMLYGRILGDRVISDANYVSEAIVTGLSKFDHSSFISLLPFYENNHFSLLAIEVIIKDRDISYQPLIFDSADISIEETETLKKRVSSFLRLGLGDESEIAEIIFVKGHQFGEVCGNYVTTIIEKIITLGKIRDENNNIHSKLLPSGNSLLDAKRLISATIRHGILLSINKENEFLGIKNFTEFSTLLNEKINLNSKPLETDLTMSDKFLEDLSEEEREIFDVLKIVDYLVQESGFQEDDRDFLSQAVSIFFISNLKGPNPKLFSSLLPKEMPYAAELHKIITEASNIVHNKQEENLLLEPWLEADDDLSDSSDLDLEEYNSNDDEDDLVESNEIDLKMIIEYLTGTSDINDNLKNALSIAINQILMLEEMNRTSYGSPPIEGEIDEAIAFSIMLDIHSQSLLEQELKTQDIGLYQTIKNAIEYSRIVSETVVNKGIIKKM